MSEETTTTTIETATPPPTETATPPSAETTTVPPVSDTPPPSDQPLPTPSTPESATSSEPPPEPPPERVVPAEDGYILPEGLPQELATFAHKNDMTQVQLDQSLQYFGNIMTAKAEAERNSLIDMGMQHVESWGDKKDYNLNLASRALAQNDPDGQLKSALESSGYGSHPAVLNFLVRLGESMKEGGFLKSAVNRPPGKKTAAQTIFSNHPSAED